MNFNELTERPRPDDGSEPIIKAFVKFASQKLGLKEPPRIKLHRNPKLASQRRSFGGYMPGQGIEINIGNRHIMDVLRTLAHEMVHYKQDINGQLKPDSGKDGSNEENEANAKAAVIMRLWAKMNPELFQHATILAESQKKRLTTKHIHKVADKKRIKWDDEPAFLKLTRRITGHRYLDDLDQDGLFKMKNYLDNIDENFADGKHPEDKGDSARHGIPKKASLSTLDKITHSDASPRKKQLAHWQANMRRGQKK